jgi:LysR family glycine cleavage system transcriptional activator
MSERLPPLDNLLFFEVAARHLNFTRAAAELCVTPGAVSQRIKMLEEFLAVPLFERDGRSMKLTQRGSDLYLRVSRALSDIATAVELVQRQPSQTALTLSVMPVFAMRWLMPRLHKFNEHHPDICINIRPSQTLIDLDRENVDLAVRFGNGNWPSVQVEKLMDEELFPVCTPDLSRKFGLASPGQLTDVPLLHDERQPWSLWFHACSLPMEPPLSGPTYTDANLLIEAALAGHGVALARASFVQYELAAGRLIRPFEQRIKTTFSHYLVYPKRNNERDDVRLLKAWLLEEAGQ